LKRLCRNVILGIELVIASLAAYTLQCLLFHRYQDTLYYMLQDFAFLPIQVLLVTVVLSDFLTRREKIELQKKMNMVIGAFFSEVGTPLLKSLAEFDQRTEEISEVMSISAKWSEKDFAGAMKFVKSHDHAVDSRTADLQALKDFLHTHRSFMLGLLENPNLLEHDSFTELLWATFHLTEELCERKQVFDLPPADFSHLSGDIQRAYTLLIAEWLAYIKHLKADYPYIFSLVVRTNPFDREASVVIES